MNNSDGGYRNLRTREVDPARHAAIGMLAELANAILESDRAPGVLEKILRRINTDPAWPRHARQMTRRSARATTPVQLLMEAAFRVEMDNRAVSATVEKARQPNSRRSRGTKRTKDGDGDNDSF